MARDAELSLLQELNASFPHLCDLNSIGRSINQRELWVLTIAKDPRVHVPGRPEFKYVANMHGNEVGSFVRPLLNVMRKGR